MRTYLLACGATLLLGLGCGSEASHTPSSATCQDGLARLQECIDNYCVDSTSKTCTSLRNAGSGSLRGASTDPCASMNARAVDHLMQASCEDLLKEAGLVLDGTADGQCPPYFPWCEQIDRNATGYSVQVESFETGQIILDVSIHDLGYTSTLFQGQAFHELTLDASGRTPDIGKPAIPSIGLMIGVPGGTDTAWVESYEIKETAFLQDLHLAPLQQVVLEDAPPPEFAFDAASYALDAPYPGYQHVVGEIATWRNFRVVRVDTFPLQYNPVHRELEVATRFRITVRFADQHPEPIDTVDYGRESFAAAYDETLVNYYEATDDGQTPPPAPTDERVRYLFVVDDPLLGAIQPLIDQKEIDGVKTDVLLTSSVAEGEGTLAERIKTAIQARYEQDAIEYVLLVGEPEAIPLYNWNGNQSDSWYGCLAGDDLLPEVAIGRMMGKTPEELTIHVHKTLAHYGQMEQPSEAWRNHVLLVAHEQDYPKKYTECLESIRSAEYRTSKVEFSKLYGAEQATNEQVIELINQGVSIVNYRGHGSETAWHEWNHQDFRVDEAPFTNENKLPVVFSIACLNSSYQNQQTSMAEHWVLHPSGGAVAVLGATQPSYTIVNHDFNRYLFQALLNEGVSEIGALLHRANAKLFNQYGDDRCAAANMRMYTWLGDPSLRIGEPFEVPPLPPPPGAVIINEVMAHPPSDTNGDGIFDFKSDEFIELVNTGQGDTDISGWTISDKIGVRFTFPQGTILPGGKALVVFGGGDIEQFADMGGSAVFVASSGLKLNDDGDAVTLSNASSERVDSMEYRAALARGSSMTRAIDADGATAFEHHPGEPPFSPGKRRDGTPF
ncbi:MAG TPA: C25 family cysteine peptidase [Polyangiaceae bacterium]|nr:C25 family cysteine peptidase [Polyangiaceae bacterium]